MSDCNCRLIRLLRHRDAGAAAYGVAMADQSLITEEAWAMIGQPLGDTITGITLLIDLTEKIGRYFPIVVITRETTYMNQGRCGH